MPRCASTFELKLAHSISIFFFQMLFINFFFSNHSNVKNTNSYIYYNYGGNKLNIELFKQKNKNKNKK